MKHIVNGIVLYIEIYIALLVA